MTNRAIRWRVGGALIVAATAADAAGPGTSAQAPPNETLRLRITGEGTRVSDVCDISGRCPTDREKETWTISISPAGVKVEGEFDALHWFSPNADEYERACYVAGSHRGRFHLREIEWDDDADDGRSLTVEIEPTSPPSRGAQASGNCPQVVPHTDGQGRPYDAMVEMLEENALTETFSSVSGSARVMLSEEYPEGSSIIRQYRLEVLEGDVTDLDRYLTLRTYLESLRRRGART